MRGTPRWQRSLGQETLAGPAARTRTKYPTSRRNRSDRTNCCGAKPRSRAASESDRGSEACTCKRWGTPSVSRACVTGVEGMLRFWPRRVAVRWERSPHTCLPGDVVCGRSMRYHHLRMRGAPIRRRCPGFRHQGGTMTDAPTPSQAVPPAPKYDAKHDEKEEEKSEEKGEEKWRRDPLGSVIWAGILIWAGLVLLADNLGWLAGIRRWPGRAAELQRGQPGRLVVHPDRRRHPVPDRGADPRGCPSLPATGDRHGDLRWPADRRRSRRRDQLDGPRADRPDHDRRDSAATEPAATEVGRLGRRFIQY